jgi:hypothetical protein
MSFRANANRAASADAALVAYMFRTSYDCEDCLEQLLCDLMHWADKARLDFGTALRHANFDYAVQVADEEAAA